jgi:CRP-like cAMP-binding protein
LAMNNDYALQPAHTDGDATIMATRAGFRERLRHAPLFSRVTDADLDEVVEFSRPAYVEKDKLLFRKNEPCSACYLLVSGLLTLQVHGPRGQEKTVELVQPGETFAEDALFSGFGYPADARAVADSSLIAIEAFPFARLLQQRPNLAWHLLGGLSRRLYQRERQIESLSLWPAEQRVAAYLLESCDPERAALPVTRIPPRRKEFASILGITVETLCRVLGSFRRRALISVGDTGIVILDHQRLRGLVQN